MSHTYKTNYLKQVIFRIDFEEVKLGDFDSFKNRVGDRFGEGEKKKTRVANFEFNTDTEELADLSESVEVWQFTGAELGNKFEAAADHCLIEYFSYKDSKELRSDVESLCQTFLSLHNVTQATRIGLRYINQINLPNVRKMSDWSGYIANELLVASDFLRTGTGNPTRALNHIELKTESYVNVSLRYGIWNEKYPNPITNNAYILDIDCFTRLPVDLESDGLIDVMSSLNAQAEGIFEKSITAKLRKEMEK